MYGISFIPKALLHHKTRLLVSSPNPVLIASSDPLHHIFIVLDVVFVLKEREEAARGIELIYRAAF